MKKIVTVLFLCLFLVSCGMHPKNFTYTYNKEDTGLSRLIDIDGYYVSERGCDSTFYSIYRFYPDGLFAIATASEISPELAGCFENGNHNTFCTYILQGIYVLEGDRIRTQVVWPVGNGCTVFRDYRILPDGRIVNISDYVQAEYSNLAYLKNYPSFDENPCGKAALFYKEEKKGRK
ncbi:MAG: hypothetical protein LBO74_00570 [Candidatus Symbiothrix sp.]|jgi:hypothetical protein|nr:hypothetical protein [Candidatus Symbiothrix sp.]